MSFKHKHVCLKFRRVFLNTKYQYHPFNLYLNFHIIIEYKQINNKIKFMSQKVVLCSKPYYGKTCLYKIFRHESKLNILICLSLFHLYALNQYELGYEKKKIEFYERIECNY